MYGSRTACRLFDRLKDIKKLSTTCWKNASPPLYAVSQGRRRLVSSLVGLFLQYLFALSFFSPFLSFTLVPPIPSTPLRQLWHLSERCRFSQWVRAEPAVSCFLVHFKVKSTHFPPQQRDTFNDNAHFRPENWHVVCSDGAVRYATQQSIQRQIRLGYIINLLLCPA